MIKLKNIKIISFHLFVFFDPKTFGLFITFNWIDSNAFDTQNDKSIIKMNPKTRLLAQCIWNLSRVFPSFPVSFLVVSLLSFFPSTHLRTSLPQAEEARRRREEGCKRAEKIGNRCEIALVGCMPGSQDYLRRVITARCERMEIAVGRPGESITASGHKIPRCGMRVKRIHAQLCVISYHSMMWYVYGMYVIHSKVETSTEKRTDAYLLRANI